MAAIAGAIIVLAGAVMYVGVYISHGLVGSGLSNPTLNVSGTALVFPVIVILAGMFVLLVGCPDVLSAILKRNRKAGGAEQAGVDGGQAPKDDE